MLLYAYHIHTHFPHTCMSNKNNKVNLSRKLSRDESLLGVFLALAIPLVMSGQVVSLPAVAASVLMK